MATIDSKIKEMADVDIFSNGAKDELFIGRPFYLDYEKAFLLVNDFWKSRVNGIPQGAFLLAFYDNEENVEEAILLRALRPTKLPTESDVISSMIEYYKDNLKTSGNQNQLDELTRYEFSFSGLECSILGTFYKNNDGTTEFGADVENFYSANNYQVYKATDQVLQKIVNQRDGEEVAGNENEFDIGVIRYSSSRRFQTQSNQDVNVYINPKDFLGKRTALFGMTRTGKSNTVKKIIEATKIISDRAETVISTIPETTNPATLLDPFSETGAPNFKAGQIIFDINGEYANPNLQDDGTAIYELFSDIVTRYSVLEKPGFKVLKINFYNELISGFELIRSYLAEDTANATRSFTSVDLIEPENTDRSAHTRWERKRAAYLCCLYKAGFIPPDRISIRFQGNQSLNELVRSDGSLNPARGITLEEASNWFSIIWDNYNSNEYFNNYRRDHDGREWADEDLQALLIMLTKKRTPGSSVNWSGYFKLRPLIDLHTNTMDNPFEEEIINLMRKGDIVIIDLSQGDPAIQRIYSERICRRLFADSMNRFIQNLPNNFVQFYFEEAHNLFPKKDDKDLSQIYNRIAKEGAKLNLGLVYATQEVSSISSNILKNTQNWFIAHLNNDDELRELRKYYDFADFTNSLIRFSSKSDKGFVRMKTYSNPFVIPVQIHRFLANSNEAE